MAVHESTEALKAEIARPTVLSTEDFKAAARQFRQCVALMSAQVSQLQQLVVDVEEDETDPLITGKLERAHSKLRAVDHATTEAERRYQVLSRAVRSLFDDVLPDLVEMIERVESRGDG